MAESFAGSATTNAFVFQKVTAPTFCLMVLYPAHAMTKPLATEWKYPP